MARKSRALRQKQAKRQGIAPGKQTAEHPQGSSTAVQGTVSATVASKTAEVAPAPAVVAELANKQAGSTLLAATPMQQQESASVSNAPSELALVQQSADSVSAAPVAKEELVMPAANCANPSDRQRLNVVFQDPAVEPDDSSVARVMPAVAVDEPREPSMTAVGTLEQQSEDSVTPSSSLPLADAAGVSEPLKSNTAAATALEDPALEIDKPPVAAGVSEPLKSNTAAATALEDPALEIDKPPVVPLPLAADLDDLADASAALWSSQDPDLVDDVVASGPQEPCTAETATLEDPAPEVEKAPTALADDLAAKTGDRLLCAKSEVATTFTPQYDDETAEAAVVVAAEALEECARPPRNQAAIASEVTAVAVSKAVEAASEVRAAVADEIPEPPTVVKISKLEVQSDLPPNVADIPSPCRERVTPKYEAR
eukprot:CAMPEP_0172934468 /NCGR_PEP_ID=MMETSP1075-20121228/221026_1 /TAXON_ID=2916 /ORGANISM="Ceratium fusus, Strain PA161109" /LENGTH=427 /DNA_ID=CAMNT_0013795821 /DNA_START=55 /DNA_END=1335 /DNA_ORIENTATION=+